MSYIYIDRDHVEHQVSTKAQHDILQRDRYLEDGGLSYQSLIELKGKVITLYIEGGKYYDQNVDDSNFITIDSIFLPLTLNQVVVELSHHWTGGMHVEFILELFDISINSDESHTVHKTNKVYLVDSVGFNAHPDDIWEDELSKTYTPYIEVNVTSSTNWDGWESDLPCGSEELCYDLYELNAQLILPDGITIGK